MEKFKCGHDKIEDNSDWRFYEKRGKGYVSCTTCRKQSQKKCQRKNLGRISAYQVSWRGKNPTKMAHYKRLSNYKLTQEMYEELINRFGGTCHLCGITDKPHKNGYTSFHIDHDHKCCPGRKTCGKCTRGLVCFACNRMLGSLEKRDIGKVLSYIGFDATALVGCPSNGRRF